MDKHEREQLKHDVFVEEVAHSIDYASKHKTQLIMYVVLAVAIVAGGFGWRYWREGQAAERQKALRDALQNQQAAVGPGSSPFIRTFPTQEAKDAAIIKSFTELIQKYPSSDEAAMGDLFIGITYSDQGKFDDAEKAWKNVIANSSSEYANLARFSLGQLYTKQNKIPQAEEQFRYIADHPSALVSKETALIELAKAIAPTKPEEAKKILEPLRQMSTRNAVSRWAISAYGEANAAEKK